MSPFAQKQREPKGKERKGTWTSPCYGEQGGLTRWAVPGLQMPSACGGLRDHPHLPCSLGVPLPCTLSATTNPSPPVPHTSTHPLTFLEPTLGPHQPTSPLPPPMLSDLSCTSAFQPVCAPPTPGQPPGHPGPLRPSPPPTCRLSPFCPCLAL